MSGTFETDPPDIAVSIIIAGLNIFAITQPNPTANISATINETACFDNNKYQLVCCAQLSMQANGALAIVIVVFRNRAYDDTLLEMKNEATACGFEVGAAIAAVTEHSIMHQFGKARPDAKDNDELQGYADAIKELIAHRNILKDFNVPGNQLTKNMAVFL